MAQALMKGHPWSERFKRGALRFTFPVHVEPKVDDCGGCDEDRVCADRIATPNRAAKKTGCVGFSRMAALLQKRLR